MGALSGYRVLDLSIAMAGPFAAMRLGDLGADVLKIEPTTGEWQRHVSAGGATGNKINASFLSLNRNKRSLALDLKDPTGQEILRELVRDADVFLQNYRPGVAARLKVDYETLRAINPKLIYVSISGYGEDGPYAYLPGQDLLLQAMSGAMYSAGRATEAPAAAPFFIADAIAAYSAFEGALAALLHRERTGEGQLVQVNMLDAIIALQMQELSIYTVGGVPQNRTAEPHAHTYIRAPYAVFETTDGYMALAFAPLATLAELLDIPELSDLDDERDGFERRDEIHARVAKVLRERPRQHWLDLLGSHGVWVGPVNSYEDLIHDPQVRHNGSLITYNHPTEGEITTPGFPYRLSATPPGVLRGAPLAGEHTREVLASIGRSPAQIDAMLSAGVVAASQP